LFASITLQIRRILEAFRERGSLRVDVPFDELVVTTAVICSVDTYLRTTSEDWSLDQNRAWTRRILAETIIRTPAR
jgi:hypothetical protein